VTLIVDCSATDNDNSKPSTRFNDNIIINTKTAVTNLPDVRSVKRTSLCIGSQHQYCRTMHIKYRTDLACAWQLK
jgi:hypothetical protein